MPSSERRMDLFLPSPVTSPILPLTEEVEQSNASPTRDVDVALPDPRWPHLHRWTASSSSPATTQSLGNIPILGSSDLANVSAPVEASLPSIADVCQTQAPACVDPTSSRIEIGEKISDFRNVISPAKDQRAQSFCFPKGAWERPLSFASPLPRDCSRKSQWPALRQQGRVANELSNVSRPDSESPELQAISREYPWAAKMNPSLRNLHRVTIPEYMEDGTPKVKIPSHVLLGGVENQREFVVGQFIQCSAPARGHIQAVVTRIWGKKCRIFCRKLGDSTFLFHIPDESTRKWVLQRGLWHVDDCLMFVSTWTPADTISVPEITTVPVWLTLKNIPDQLYSIKGIKWIASGLGEPMSTEKPWLDPTQMGEAKILVEVKLNKPFPQRVALVDVSDAITMVDVIYSWLPSKCSLCGHLGHKPARCLLRDAMSSSAPAPTVDISASAPAPALDSVSVPAFPESVHCF